jgi:hypothetical protein
MNPNLQIRKQVIKELVHEEFVKFILLSRNNRKLALNMDD